MSRNPQLASVVLDDITTTTPGNPPTGKHKVVDRNGTFFIRDSSGAEVAIGTSASVGSGEKNYISNPSGAAATTGWEAYGDLAIARTTTASELPRENTTKTGLKITADADTQGTGDIVYFNFTLDDVDLNRQLKIKFDVKKIGTYDGKLQAYIATAADVATQVAGGAVAPAIAGCTTTVIQAADGTFYLEFTSGSTAALSLVIQANADMTTGDGIGISDVVVGPGLLVSGAIPAKEYVAGTTYNGVALNVTSAQSGWAVTRGVFVPYKTSDGAWRLRFNIVGSFSAATITGLTVAIAGVVFKNTSSFFQTCAAGTNAAAAASGIVTPNTGNIVISHASILTNGVFISGDVELDSQPTWADGQTTAYYGNEQVEYASNSSTNDGDDTTAFAYGQRGSAFVDYSSGGSKTVRFSRISPSDTFIFEIQDQTVANAPWVPLINRFGTSDAFYVQSFQRQNTSYYGCGQIVQVSSTDVKVGFASYATASGATYGAAGSAWTGVSTKLRWRVKKVSSPGLAGFSVATTSQPVGLYQAGAAPGSTTGAAIAQGNIGERKEVTFDFNTATAGVFSTSTGIALGLGVWRISVSATFNPTSGITAGLVGISTDSAATTFTDLDYSPNFHEFFASSAFTPGHCIFVEKNVTSATTYYAKLRVAGNSTRIRGTFFATRIA
jgi:hypothetical protein